MLVQCPMPVDQPAATPLSLLNPPILQAALGASFYWYLLVLGVDQSKWGGVSLWGGYSRGGVGEIKIAPGPG